MIRDFYATAPADVKPGDVFLVGLKAMVQYDGSVRLYRFRLNDPDVLDSLNCGEEPQGAWLPLGLGHEYTLAITSHVLPVLTGRQIE